LPSTRHEFSPTCPEAQEGNPGAQTTGFFIHHTTGSHHILKHPSNAALRVTVAYHNRDLERRTLESIIKQAGLSPEQFKGFL
jgi:predicted RNA binding protein YcfA (HicA-like mRNA interferase family)